MMRRSKRLRCQGGFTYLMLLVALSALAVSLLKSSDTVRMHHREQLEKELLFRGEQIRAAIAAYRADNTGENGCFPVRFEQLLDDPRGSRPRYHLRQLYADPLTQKQAWGMIYDEKGRWIGVHSMGKGKPLRKTGFRPGEEAFSDAKSYRDWRFVVEGDSLAPLPTACG